jgi:hypothetical protein
MHLCFSCLIPIPSLSLSGVTSRQEKISVFRSGHLPFLSLSGINQMRRYTSPASITLKDPVTYDLMSGDDALRQMAKIVRDVNEVLGLPSTTIVRLLLNHYHWDQNVLIQYMYRCSNDLERFWEDPDRLFKQCKIPNPMSSPSVDDSPLSPQPNDVQKSSAKTKGVQLVNCRT